MKIPYSELEEWRGQAIDTLFDIYSNEQFDVNFNILGFMPLLGELLKMGQEKKKKSKFIKAVLEDIKRFIAYKQENMKIM